MSPQDSNNDNNPENSARQANNSVSNVQLGASEPIIIQRDHFSKIWFIPMVAAAIGLYLLYQAYINAGINIELKFDSGAGIEAGTTKILFRGLPVGIVTSVKVNEDLNGVIVNAEMDQSATPLLKNTSKFWLVEPKVSLSGVSGLDALVSGNYIAVQPGKGDSRYKFTALQEAPPIDFDTPGLHLKLEAEELGSIAEQSQIYYRKIPVGRVISYHLNEKNDGVTFNVHIKSQFAHLINSTTQFWDSSWFAMSGDLSELKVKVKSESIVSMITGGISFETLDPDFPASKNNDRFRLHSDYEATDLANKSNLADTNYLRIILEAKELGSISNGSKIYYRKIPVGEVYGYELNKTLDQVDIFVKVKKQYSHLISADTRFWNVSGVSVSAGLSGLDLRTESLAAMVSGGIALRPPQQLPSKHPSSNHKSNKKLPQDSSPVFSEGQRYKLYEDYESAGIGIGATLNFKQAEGISAGKTLVKYQGITIGRIQSIQFSQGPYPVKTRVIFHPDYKKFLNEDTQFWLVSPQISLTQVKGLDTLLGGNYVTLKIGNGEASREFDVLPSAPLGSDQAKGLMLTLTAKELGSIQAGSKIYFKKIPVGSVLSYSLNAKTGEIKLSVMIQAEYAYLINQGTKFWNASGLSVSGGLAGVKIETESLLSVLAGGIAFESDLSGNIPAARNGHQFPLFSNFDAAQKTGSLIEISFDRIYGLKTGAPIKFKDITVGVVETIALSKDMNKIIAHGRLDPESAELATEDALFWLVRPRLGIARTSDLDTLISGPYIAMMPGEGKLKQVFEGMEATPQAKLITRQAGLHITLKAPRLGSIKEGLDIYYRDIAVGQVTGYDLSTSAQQVLIFIHIEPKHQNLVRSNSKFWNTSGFNVDFGLMNGLSVQTKSLEAALAGGIAFATPEKEPTSTPAQNGDQFKLHDTADEKWLAWQPDLSPSDRVTK